MSLARSGKKRASLFLPSTVRKIKETKNKVKVNTYAIGKEVKYIKSLEYDKHVQELFFLKILRKYHNLAPLHNLL